MKACGGTTQKGKTCKRAPLKDSEFCYQHQKDKKSTCEGTTLKGESCEKLALKDSKFCHQHQKDSQKKSTCEGTTLKGESCERVALKDSKFCHQHQEDKREPWEKLGIKIPSTVFSKKLKYRLRSILRKGPDKKKDTSGFIYIYYLPQDKGLSYYKVGRTERTVHQRLKEWKGEATLLKAFRVSYNKFAESVIHTVFGYYRIYRYQHDNGYHSVWVHDESVLNDEQQNEKLKLKDAVKNIEWFAVEEDLLVSGIRSIVKILNKM